MQLLLVRNLIHCVLACPAVAGNELAGIKLPVVKVPDIYPQQFQDKDQAEASES